MKKKHKNKGTVVTDTGVMYWLYKDKDFSTNVCISCRTAQSIFYSTTWFIRQINWQTIPRRVLECRICCAISAITSSQRRQRTGSLIWALWKQPVDTSMSSIGNCAEEKQHRGGQSFADSSYILYVLQSHSNTPSLFLKSTVTQQQARSQKQWQTQKKLLLIHGLNVLLWSWQQWPTGGNTDFIKQTD